ncbi:GumC family protein [Flavobacterium restrictum]|uniref:non-specific protein-tyrosine kinase n=1 Tax=Flavobacterium restrictum TaxID=2594428 RepID=A0A553E5I3_9FLAO|nr:tyrosine-protein kinase [Flavobacterium restrictum]TRX40123.1 polysaccharide biosynthesis tyrosine autokinase [Flavobacterium restrictum]
MKEHFIAGESQEEEDFNLRAIIDKYSIHWKWFVLCVLVSMIVAFMYLRYTAPQYRATTTILVKDDKKGGMLSELSSFADLGLGGGLKSNVDNEVEILKSRTLVESTVKKLNFNISLIVKGNVRDVEIYNDGPITVYFVNTIADFDKVKVSFDFIPVTANTFKLDRHLSVDNSKFVLGVKKEFQYGEIIKTIYGDLQIAKKDYDKKKYPFDGSPISVKIYPIDVVVDSYLGRLGVTSISKTSSVVELTITDPVIDKAQDFLDNLIQIYNRDAVEDKNFISEKTSEFISNRLKLITQELDGVEQDVESFKQTNKLTDIESEAQLFIKGSNEYSKQVIETEIQMNVVTSMLDFMKKSTNSDLLPTSIIAGQTDATGMINSYNELVLDRNRILKSATTANPSVVKLDQQITSLKANVVASLNRIQATLSIQKRDLNSNEGVFNAKISKIPVQERQFRVIARQQKVKEELYLYLLQKREETAISLSATEPNARVIDAARASTIPVAPKKNIVYLAAFLLGLLVPFGFIYVDDLLDTKIKSRLDLEGRTNIPFIGDVPTSETPTEIIKSENRTSTAEALRIIRTNLEFMINQVDESLAKTFFVTSTFPHEGKTFASVNLAATFALSGKKVLLVGMDIRNPKIDEYVHTPHIVGVTNYLHSSDYVLDDLIVKQEGYEAFYCLPAGVIPPNPAELLMSNRVELFFKELKSKFDYIIVDTAPVSLVTDTLLIAKYADCFVYVVRANFLEKRMLAVANVLFKDKKLPNMCMLLNDSSATKGYGYGYGYGRASSYGYGYGYGVKTKKLPWYKKIFSA